MLLVTALALLITGDVLNRDVYCSKQTGSSAATQRNHHPSFLRFWNWAEETVDAAKICGGAENVVKTETQQTFKWIARFHYFRHLYPLKRGIAHTLVRVAHR